MDTLQWNSLREQEMGYFTNFNGTAGLWRRQCIEEAGGWQSDTLTEDLDLSYRAQLKGWKYQYLHHIHCPAELPTHISAIKQQQQRWSKGAAQTAKKLLMPLLRSSVSTFKKVYGVLHLFNSHIFLLILSAALCSVPLLYIKSTKKIPSAFFAHESIFLVGFVVLIFFYFTMITKMSPSFWRRGESLVKTFPLFLAFSMGLSLANSWSVIEGWLNISHTFKRTPKKGNSSIGYRVPLQRVPVLLRRITCSILSLCYLIRTTSRVLRASPLSYYSFDRIRRCILLRTSTEIRRLLFAVSSAGLYLYLTSLERSETWNVQLSVALLFALYTWGVQLRWTLYTLIGVGVGLRIVFMTEFPVLSDDFYRFLWDGLLWHQGVHPMVQIPSETLIETSEQCILYENMNSSHYLSPYPSIHQGVFYLSTLGYTSPLEALTWMRIIHTLTDVLSCVLLFQLSRSLFAASVYLLHPLVIVEGVGNVHFEGYVLLFLLISLWGLQKKTFWISAAGIALATATKLLPLTLLPYFFWYIYIQINRRAACAFLIYFVIGSILLLIPLWDKDLWKSTSSLLLYFNTFEMNASLYFLLKLLPFHLFEQHIVTYLVPLLTFLGVLSLSLWSARAGIQPARALLWLMTFYFALATTVHPWYILPIVGLAGLSGRYFPLIWGYVIFFSYIGYTKTGYTPPYFWIGIEYVIVSLFAVFEKRICALLHIR